jgi:hypothetical protein
MDGKGKNGGAAETDKELAQFTREKAAADARLASINADAAAQKARFASLQASGLNGSVTTATGAGNAEATLLAARALEIAAQAIAAKVNAIRGGKAVQIQAGIQPLSLGNWQAFQIQSDLVKAGFRHAAQALRQADELEGGLSDHDDILTLTGRPLSLVELGQVESVRLYPSGGAHLLGATGAGAGIGAALDLASKLASYFRADYQLSGATVAGLDDTSLALAVAGKLAGARMPFLWSGAGHTDGLSGLLAPLENLEADMAPDAKAGKDKSRKYAKAAAAEPDEDRKTALTQLSAAFDRGVAAFDAAQKNLDAMIASLATPDKDGVPAAMKVLNEQKLAAARPGLVLMVKLATAAGSNYVKKDIWSTLFGQIPFFAAGGVIAEFLLMDSRHGDILAGGQMPVHGGYYSVDQISDRINDNGRGAMAAQPEPGPLRARLAGSDKLATLTTIDGDEIVFAPAHICAVSDRDAATGDSVTCVYGIAAAPVHTNEDAQAFLTRLSLLNGFANLTRPDSTPVWLCSASVGLIRLPKAGEYDPAVHTVVVAGSLTQGLLEDMQTVRAALNAHGGSA